MHYGFMGSNAGHQRLKIGAEINALIAKADDLIECTALSRGYFKGENFGVSLLALQAVIMAAVTAWKASDSENENNLLNPKRATQDRNDNTHHQKDEIMTNDITLRDEDKDITTTGRISALYAHPYKVHVEFETKRGPKTHPITSSDGRVGFYIPYAEFERYAAWVAQAAAAYAKEGFLNKKAWPENIVKEAIKEGKDLDSLEVIQRAGAHVTHASVKRIEALPDTLTLEISSQRLDSKDPSYMQRQLQMTLTQEEFNNLALLLALEYKSPSLDVES